MDWTEILSTSAVTTFLLAALGFILRNSFLTLLNENIRAEYERSLAKYKEEVRWESVRKDKSAAIAEILSLWTVHNYDSARDINLTRWELQKKYWELSLWLDAPTLRILNEALTASGPPGTKHKKALSEVRKLIIGSSIDDIRPEEFVHWNAIDIHE